MASSDALQQLEHTHHMARLALECALRARSGGLLLRLREFLGARPTLAGDPGLQRALQRALAAEQVWLGEPQAAVSTLEHALAGPPGGRYQALARLDLVGLHIARADAAAAGSHLAWIAPWVNELPEGLTAHAGFLALQGQFDAAVDAQLAALRLRRGPVPARWYADLEHYAQGRRPPAEPASNLLTLS